MRRDYLLRFTNNARKGALMQVVQDKLNEIRVKAALMSSTVERMFKDGMSALLENNRELGRIVVDRDDEVDRLEVELEHMCLSFLALHAPKASELRYVVAVSRLSLDLERVGDHSSIMGKYAVRSYLTPLISAFPDFEAMGTLAGSMLSDAITAFFSDDSQKYQELAEKDLEIGKYQDDLNTALMDLIVKDMGKTRDAVSVINIVRRIERVADHAKNIAALSPYVTEGIVVRGIKTKKNANLDY
jgi:phosphate transport system protein